MKTFKELIVWQKAIELVKLIYFYTKELPKEELYVLVSQMRRCSVSIPSNIAEGFRRRTLGQYVQFLCIADASAAELETQLIICKQLYPKINGIDQCLEKLEEIQKMLASLIFKLKK